jgi:LAS superfamily LD-carboxypeptidase LdcB
VTPAELTGRARSHIGEMADPPCALHAHVIAPFRGLRRAAAADGFDVIPASGFRDFARQLAIWNGKFNGAIALHDASGELIDGAALAPRERIEAILLWSALPGASRHHWGTDLDLIDRRAVPQGYRVRLTAEEFAPPGPFAPLAAWLETNAPRFGFFRPFRGVLSGVRAEPWHFSFAPIAEPARRRLSSGLLREALQRTDLAGAAHVLEQIEELHARYVAGIDWP